MLQERKKKQGASSNDSDTSERGVDHRIGIVAVVSAKG